MRTLDDNPEGSNIAAIVILGQHGLRYVQELCAFASMNTTEPLTNPKKAHFCTIPLKKVLNLTNATPSARNPGNLLSNSQNNIAILSPSWLKRFSVSYMR